MQISLPTFVTSYHGGQNPMLGLLGTPEGEGRTWRQSRAASQLSHTKGAATFVAIARSSTTERFGRNIDTVSVAQPSREKRGARNDFRSRTSLAGGCCRGYHDFDFDRHTSALLV
jgi:hypothetical protein